MAEASASQDAEVTLTPPAAETPTAEEPAENPPSEELPSENPYGETPSEENPPAQQPTAPLLDRQIAAGTGFGGFYLFHPQYLQHRRASPAGWDDYGFALGPEMATGRLVAINTTSGGYNFRVTDGPLTEREKKWLSGSHDFRYVVRHGIVLLDGGDSLPCDDYFDDSDRYPEQWIELPNGDYRVTFNSLKWYDEPGATDDDGQPTPQALPDYVIQFSPVDDLQSIESTTLAPMLDPYEEPGPGGDYMIYEMFEENKDLELDEAYVVLVSHDQAPIPGYNLLQVVSDEFYEAVNGTEGNMILPDRIEQIVLASDDQTPCLGVVAEPNGSGRSGDGPWRIGYDALRLVTVTSIEPTDPWPTATVQPVERPESQVEVADLEALKAAFAQYAAASEAYQTAVRYPEFEAERVAAMTNAEGITHVLIHHIQMPIETKLELLPLSDAERVERLQTILNEENQGG